MRPIIAANPSNPALIPVLTTVLSPADSPESSLVLLIVSAAV